MKPAYDPLLLYIDGEFIEGGGRREQDVHDPATGKVHRPAAARHARPTSTARWPRPQRAFETLAHRVAAGEALGHAAPGRRADARARRSEIGRNITLDQGKPLAEAVGEVAGCAEHCRLARRGMPPHLRPRDPAARSPDVRQMVLREPVGVCAAFTPWNFPFNQAIRKMAAALGAGCTHRPQGAGGCAQRRGGDRAAVPRRRPAAGRASTSCGACRARCRAT